MPTFQRPRQHLTERPATAAVISIQDTDLVKRAWLHFSKPNHQPTKKKKTKTQPTLGTIGTVPTSCLLPDTSRITVQKPLYVPQWRSQTQTHPSDARLARFPCPSSPR